MNSQIQTAIKTVFDDFLNPNAWVDLKNVFKDANCQSFYVRPIHFKKDEFIQINFNRVFKDDRQLKSFLIKERKLAVAYQEFEIAAKVKDFTANLKGDNLVIPFYYLKYSINKREGDVYEVLFETNLLSFKYRLIEEFSIGLGSHTN